MAGNRRRRPFMLHPHTYSSDSVQWSGEGDYHFKTFRNILRWHNTISITNKSKRMKRARKQLASERLIMHQHLFEEIEERRCKTCFFGRITLWWMYLMKQILWLQTGQGKMCCKVGFWKRCEISRLICRLLTFPERIFLHEINWKFSPCRMPTKRMCSLNLLNPTGYVMHQQFNIQQLYALPTLYLCVLYLSENKQRLVPLTA
jgi:hypothetical protein